MPEEHKVNLQLRFYPIRIPENSKTKEYVFACGELDILVKGSTPGAALEKLGNAFKRVKKETWEKALL